jgi:hypothetical protein
MTVIEIRPHRWGWKAFESPGVEPVFPKKDQAIDYAQNRACFRSGEIRVLDSTGNVERVIAFDGFGRARKCASEAAWRGSRSGMLPKSVDEKSKIGENEGATHGPLRSLSAETQARRPDIQRLSSLEGAV